MTRMKKIFFQIYFLVESFSSSIQFCPSERKNESLNGLFK